MIFPIFRRRKIIPIKAECFRAPLRGIIKQAMTECKRAYRIGNEYRCCCNTDSIRPVMRTARFYETLRVLF